MDTGRIPYQLQITIAYIALIDQISGIHSDPQIHYPGTANLPFGVRGPRWGMPTHLMPGSTRAPGNPVYKGVIEQIHQEAYDQLLRATVNK